LNKLDQLVVQMGSLDNILAAEADQQFHAVIAGASDNRAIVFTLETLWRMREQVPDLKPLYDLICKSDSGHRAKEHRAIFKALRARDPDAARNAMRTHFSRLLAAMLEVTEKQALEELQQRALESRARFLTTAQAA
jgi:DNA-binding FadR family transcriptional regulator